VENTLVTVVFHLMSEKTMKSRLFQTYLLDGSLDGVKIIELSESSVKAFVVPRLKLADIKDRPELTHPALYVLVNADSSNAYIGECENFYHRIRTHDQSKEFWDTAIAFVSTTNTLAKGDVKFLESLAVGRATKAKTIPVLNKVAPARNTIHEFQVDRLEQILEDIGMILASLGFDLFAIASSTTDQIWYCRTKKTTAQAVFRNGKFILLAGSVIDIGHAPSWARNFPEDFVKRQHQLESAERVDHDAVRLKFDLQFRSPNQAASFATGRSNNAWITWKDADGRTMDEVMRKGGEQ